jgi:ankyrin repeat protein
MATVLALLELGADVNGSGHNGRTALMTAAMFNRTEIVERLLAAGADIDGQDSEGRTAEILARTMGADEMAARLAETARRQAP